MSKYIDSEKLIAKLTRMQFDLNAAYRHPQSDNIVRAISLEYDDIISLVNSLQQEQPEVDLEKFTEKIKTFQGRYKYPEILSIKGAMAFMARMFYQYPNVARQWYDSLPKATMD